MWTTKETKRVYRGVTIWKFEGSKVKERDVKKYIDSILDKI